MLLGAPSRGSGFLFAAVEVRSVSSDREIAYGRVRCPPSIESCVCVCMRHSRPVRSYLPQLPGTSLVDISATNEQRPHHTTRTTAFSRSLHCACDEFRQDGTNPHSRAWFRSTDKKWTAIPRGTLPAASIPWSLVTPVISQQPGSSLGRQHVSPHRVGRLASALRCLLHKSASYLPFLCFGACLLSSCPSQPDRRHRDRILTIDHPSTDNLQQIVCLPQIAT
ncbi:hypothetical protein B0T22DRAFT_164817 [Podospora appendiculata]|uniref:Uncharacterized protein n=1 Tax=Podospora appendiculata TaxID=314037 RepID=A0AAE0XAF4_9PEZI|nr:hypothetical protein B0T22DRAFT_164817 [Podospora appendiculata]